MEPRLDIASLIFLVVLFVLTPRAALRSARVMRQAREAGAPIPRPLVTKARRALGAAVLSAWGMSENGAVTFCPGGQCASSEPWNSATSSPCASAESARMMEPSASGRLVLTALDVKQRPHTRT